MFSPYLAPSIGSSTEELYLLITRNSFSLSGNRALQYADILDIVSRGFRLLDIRRDIATEYGRTWAALSNFIERCVYQMLLSLRLYWEVVNEQLWGGNFSEFLRRKLLQCFLVGLSTLPQSVLWRDGEKEITDSLTGVYLKSWWLSMLLHHNFNEYALQGFVGHVLNEERSLRFF